MTRNYLQEILTRSSAPDLYVTHQHMVEAALNTGVIGTRYEADLFTKAHEFLSASDGDQKELEFAAVGFLANLRMLALVEYIAATTDTNCAALEIEVQEHLATSMQLWLDNTRLGKLDGMDDKGSWAPAAKHVPETIAAMKAAMLRAAPQRPKSGHEPSV